MLTVALAALLAGIVIGIYIGLAMEPGEATATGLTGLRSVLPDTQMHREIRFTLCEHCLEETVDTAGFIGYTEKELKAFYGGNAEVAFSGNGVCIRQTVEGCCPAHYLLSENAVGQLCVYMTDPETLHKDLVRVLTGYTRGDLNDAAPDSLDKGLVFATLGEIDGFLESMES